MLLQSADNKKIKNICKKPLLFLLGVLFMPLLFCNSAKGQAITLTYPTASTSYLNIIPVQYTITPTTQSLQQVQIIFTYTSGAFASTMTGKTWTLTMKTNPVTVSFTLTPLDMGNPSNVFTSTSTVPGTNVPMAEGTYSVMAKYIRTDGLTINSVIRSSVSMDLITVPPVWVLPNNNAKVSSGFVLQESIPENYKSNSKTITIAGPNNTVLNMANGKLKDSIFFNTQAITTALAPANITSVSGDAALADGNYTMTLSYQDANNHPAASSTINFTLDTHTLPPAITLPTTGSVNNQFLNLNFNIPESYLPGSAALTFSRSGASNTVSLANNLAVGANSFTLDTRHLTGSAKVLSALADTLANGNYTVSLSYQDSLGNPAASASVTNVNIKNTTAPAVITSPANNAVINATSSLNVAYTLPEKPGPGTLKLILSNTASTVTVLLAANNPGAQTLVINPQNIAASPGVISSSGNTISDGLYNMSITYADTLANSAVASNIVRVQFISHTIAPTLVLPGSGTNNTQNLQLSFTLPGAALNNTAMLQILGSQNITINLVTSGSGLQAYTLNGLDLTHSTGVASSTQATIPTGSYTLLLGYQDIYGNDMAYATQTNVALTGTTAPILTTNAITPPCGVTAVSLGSGITSATTGLTLTYYSDSVLTNLITDIVHTAGTYYVKATNTNSLSTSAPIVVNAFPVNPAVSTVSITPVCGTTSVSLASGISGSTMGLTLSYYSDAALTSPIGGSVNAAGTYYIKATNTGGCFASASIVVNAFPANPSVTTQAITPTCGATSVNLASGITGSSIGLTLSYYSDAGLINGVNSTVITAGTYYVKTTNSGGCSASAPIVVNPFPVTPVVTTQNITPLIGSFNTDLNNGITSSTSGLKVSFYSDAALNNQITANVTSPGTYYLKVTNTGGCFATASITVGAFTQTIVATNVVSPNGDGKNDTWIIKDILLYPNNKVNIYDRAGRLIYSKTGYANDWAGTSNGSPLAEGTYYYSIELGQGLPSTKGFLTILKR